MAGLSPRDHTASVLKRMNLAGSIPGNLDRNNDAQGDNYGLTAARSSDASSFKMTGAPKSPHLGRPGRQAGGRIVGELVRTRRTPQETAKDIANEDLLADELGKDRDRAATGGRIGRAGGGGVQSEAARDAENAAKVSRMSASDRDAYANERDGGRVGRARGGRAKGKTTVNVIIGGDKHLPPQGPPPMPPPPMAAPGPVGPPAPPPGRLPLPMGPPGGAPMGPMGAPPPGAPPMLRARGGRIGRQMGGAMPMGAPPVPPPAMGSPLQPGAPPPMPMRAKGGRIEIGTPGVHDYGKAGVRHGSTDEKYGGGSGLGRQERARHQK